MPPMPPMMLMLMLAMGFASSPFAEGGYTMVTVHAVVEPDTGRA